MTFLFVPVPPGKIPPEERGNEGQKSGANCPLLSPEVVYHSKEF